ncbi:MAG: hypothetical protein EHM41_19665 [Chloroflexi bacterium]|nr:MAG: hypothetical protein EHM41_19665 [Chloroflexota bacterium]
MKTNISRRDIELLSAYLDGQLDARRKAKLESRLQNETELNKMLEELSRTRTLLRSAPKLKAPRSFKLKPEMVAKRQARPVYPVFQFASAMAMILLVFVLLGDYLVLRQPMAASEETSMAMQAQDSAVEEALKEAPDERTMSREAGEADASEQPNLAMEAAPPAPEATMTAEAEEIPTFGAVTPEAEMYAVPQEESAGTPAEEPTELAFGEPENLPSARSEVQEIRRVSLPAVRIAEFVLALTALASALTAVLLKRRFNG